MTLGTNALRGGKKARGFTLIELLVATAVFSVLAMSLFALFRSAIRMRENTFKRIEDVLPRDYITKIIKRDLAATLQPNGEFMFRGDIYLDSDMSGGAQRDRLEFFTASGLVSESAPWGDVHQIKYYLEEAGDGTGGEQGFDFVRERTPLPDALVSMVQEPEAERYFVDVKSLEITWYDGEDWQDTLDTETQPDEFPVAFKMRIEFIEPEEGGRQQPPIEIMAEVLSKYITAEEEEGGGGGQGG